MINVGTHGDEAARASFRRLSRGLAKSDDLLVEVAAMVTADAREIAPKRTGRLAASVRARKINRGYVVGSALPYTQYVHYGSIHNPNPVPFIDIAAKRAAPVAHRAADSRVNAAIGRAGL